jgi:hypothetical protein
MEARREGGDGTGTTRRDRETTHLSPDDGEEAAHRRRSLGSEASLAPERRRARESLRARGGGVGVAGVLGGLCRGWGSTGEGVMAGNWRC